MKTGIGPIAGMSFLVLAAALLAACASRAPDFGGRWRHANAYAETPQEIPLQQAYLYAPSPTDGTLRNLLQRWTRDAGLRLHYEHPSDYTLHAGVADIRTPDLGQAAAMLTRAYARQGLAVMVDGEGVSVRPVDPAPAGSGR